MWGPHRMVKKSKSSQMLQVVNVKVNVGDKKKPKSRRQPRKKVASDTVLLRKGNVPSGPASRPSGPSGALSGGSVTYGSEMRLAGPGQSYANLPAPMNRLTYASSPQVMNPQLMNAFIAGADAMYNRNRNTSDDIRQVVNESDITPVREPSRRMVKSKPQEQPYGGMLEYVDMPNTHYGSVTDFGGELPRINEIELQPSARAVASDRQFDGYLNALSRSTAQAYEITDVTEEEEASMPAVSAKSEAVPELIIEPRPISRNYSKMGKDELLLAVNRYNVGNAKKQPRYQGTGMIAQMRADLQRLDSGESAASVLASPTLKEQPAMRRGGSVF